MPRKQKEKNPPRPSPRVELELRLLDALRQLSWLTLAQCNAVKCAVLPVVHDALSARSSGGRPRRHTVTERTLGQRLSALTHPRLKYLEKDPDTGKTRRVDAEGELRKRYKARGVWPDTKTKWAADTDAYLRGWWERMAPGSAEPAQPYPAAAIAEHLAAPKGPKGTGGLMTLARLLVATRVGIKPETLRHLGKKSRQ